MERSDSLEQASQVIGRLAPSPTGGLHVGHARTFLIAWLAARSAGGRIVLRIEDIDTTRVRPGATEQAIADLEWLGFDWDSGPYVQSQRMDAYREAMELLKRKELVYPCTCTRADIERAASAPHAEDEGPTYPGTCAGRFAHDAAKLAGRSFAWRFRVPSSDVSWNDLFLGEMAINPAVRGGDFSIAREPFVPSYQLAVVVDDNAMDVNQVVRGDDLVVSTPRQILISQALGAAIKRTYGHVPLVCDASGKRLAKRDGAIKLATLRADGVDPRNLIGLLAQSCGLSETIVPSRPDNWIDVFRPGSVPRASWTFNLNEFVNRL